MRFQCARGEFYRGIQIAVRTAPSGVPTQPILAHVLIQAKDDQVTLTCYDQEVGMHATVPARVETPGEATAPARLLADIIRDLPEDDIQFTADDRFNVIVSCRKSEFTLSGFSAEDYPRLPGVGTETHLKCKASLLRDIIKQTLFAVSKDGSRPALTGVYFDVADGKLTAVSTDTHRLCVRQALVPDMEGSDKIILPADALDQFVKAIPADAEDDVDIRFARNQALFQCRDIIDVSRLIEGPFPHYERVLPSSYEKVLTIEREAFQGAVKRAGLVARNEQSHRLVLRASGDSMTLTSESASVGRVKEEIPVKLEGDDVELAFNTTYLLDVLPILQGENIRMEVSGNLTPCVIRAEGDEEYRYIVMPMQMA